MVLLALALMTGAATVRLASRKSDPDHTPGADDRAPL
jgi:hypothetical protein